MLAVDAGNTRIKWGVHDGQGWSARGACPTADPAAAVAALHDVVVRERPARAAVANVAGAAVGEALAAGFAADDLPLVFLRAAAAACGVRNGYDDPARLGVDRWSALVGARALHAGPCLVVGVGTATTADVLDAEGVFQGGIILPGPDLMLRSLASGTAALPLAEGRYAALPRNTADAIVSGCLLAQAGAVERLYATVAAQPGALCLLTGGAAARVQPLLALPCRWVDNLVLEGVAVLGRAAVSPA